MFYQNCRWVDSNLGQRRPVWHTAVLLPHTYWSNYFILYCTNLSCQMLHFLTAAERASTRTHTNTWTTPFRLVLWIVLIILILRSCLKICLKNKRQFGGSPGLVVMGGDPRPRGLGFESWHWILDGHFL